ncbi:polyketide synthase [Dictyobacter sp. S3.2.2.5]|uniref:Polyketide synthase n=1 Tax=Dictyobacter halimunensis TaxID=3026934 RepID=A0ABQ6FIF7_9CHLR|nr:polyketide synthase [Dictyobacter sp. S3.2.2.5]
MLDEGRLSLPHEQTREPLAIIGIGCHFPGGATSPQAFWDLLCAGVDATRDVPDDRWDVRKFYDPDQKKSGKMNTHHGGYLERIDQFDAHFFGISPREAMWLDPQQRLLLQVSWEALEDAGQIADQLAGSNTGVFIGGFTLDYQLMQNFGVFSRYELQAHSATGMMMTMLANRISYIFGLHGPSMAVDTACSGSLVAVHLACQSIWNGECTLAFAGGVNVMIAPTMTIAESKGGFLSPDGRSKAFDASANGYARGEGAGVVLIKPLARAQADGDPIYAVIRGTAVTQDGHTNGITVPNGSAQERVMRQAYQRAGISPAQIQYVEAHGTGTPVGDPIEARAIGTVLSGDRPSGEQCIVGSVKTNIGHLEAGAGVAGLIKTALALKHRQIPPHLHFHNPNPNIPFEELQLRVPTQLEDWPAVDGPAMAGVNSFGFGGTNAHVVLQEAPTTPIQATTPEGEEETSYLLPISARDADALQASARSYRDFLAQTTASLRDIAYTATLRRSHHDHRLALVAHSKEEAVTRLDAFLTEQPRSGVVSGRIPLNERPKTAFVCSGMGPQWWAMGRDLLKREPIFRASIERVDAEFQKHADWSIMEALTASEADSRMEETEVAQPANFAIQVALADLWRSWGIEPDAYIGHSAGEVAAHYLAGALSFEDAVCIIYHRSRLQQQTRGLGRMLAVGMTPETLNQAVHDAGAGVSIAAINSPSAVTLVGESAILENMAQQLETFQVFHRFLTGKVPYHSHFMDPLRDELLASLADLHPHSASLPLYSTVTGTRIDGSGVDAHYWWQNVRATVLFASALGQMIQDGYSVFIELSPHPVLASSIKELLTQQGQEGIVLTSLRRKEEDRATLFNSLGTLYTQNYPIVWETFFNPQGTVVRLPSYPWQFKTYWTESVESHEDRLYTPLHPLLGQRMSNVHPTWERELNLHLLQYLNDHRIQNNVLLPGAAYAEIALAAAREVFGEGFYLVEELAFHKALFLTDDSDPRLRTVLHPQQARVEIYSYIPTASPEARWVLHASAQLRQLQAHSMAPQLDLHTIKHACSGGISREEFYTQSQHMGFQYGPAFQAIQHVSTGPGIALAHIQVPDSLEDEISAYAFHPSLLDAAFQVLLTAARPSDPDGAGTATPYLPVGVDRIRITGQVAQQMQVYAQLRQADDRLVVGDIQVADQQGNLLAEIEGFRAQSLEASMGLTADHIDRGLYALEWRPAERIQQTPGAEESQNERVARDEGWLIFSDQSGIGQELLAHLEEQAIPYVVISPTNAPEIVQQDGHYALNPTRPEHFRQLFEALSTTNTIAFSRLVYLWGLDATFARTATLTALEHDQSIVCLAVMYVIQALTQSGWSQLPPVWLITRGAQPVGTQPGPISIEQAPLWGLGRVIGHQEFTNMWGGLIDLDPIAGDQAALLFNEIHHATHEDQVAFRAHQRYVARLVPATQLTPAFPPTFRQDGSYLITGGLGSLGLLVARWMVSQGARRLILMGRTPLPARSSWHQLAADHPQQKLIHAIREMEKQGATIHLAAVDVANEEQLSTFLADYQNEGWPVIRGVIHTAGVVQDELLLRMKTEAFERVLRPKLRGGWLLHHLLKDYPLDFFLLFSSTGSVIASLGQGNYAAANAFLDALAAHRSSQGLPALSIGWGPWSIGMVEQLKLEQFYAQRGIDLITPEAGMQILGRVMGQRTAQLTAISANWSRAREASPVGILPPMFELLGEQEGEVSTGAVASDDGLLQQLSAVEPAERQPLLLSHMQDLVARVLQLDPSQFSGQEALTSLGMDSMMAIELKHRIAASVKIDMPVLELLQGITVAQLATRILSSLQFEEVAPAAESSSSLDEIQRLIEQADSEEIERLLAELEQIPDVSDAGANV